ncbi:15778_t:CDS:2, partial [Funneliformis caledonium]
KYKYDELYYLKIKYQDPKGSERLKYRINYTYRQDFELNGKIGDIFDS